MTTTGKFTVETTNDEGFEVGATYDVTVSVSSVATMFGVTKASDAPVVAVEEPAPTVTDEADAPGVDDTSGESAEPTTPATA